MKKKISIKKKSNIKSDTKSDIKSDLIFGIKSDTKSDIKSDIKSDTKSDIKSDFKYLESTKSNLNSIRILSIDVGIINLAYCVLVCNKSKGDFKIEKWGLINLIDNHFGDFKCIAKLKSGKRKGNNCNNKAICFKENLQDECYCGSHHKILPINKRIQIKYKLLCEKKLQSGKKKGSLCGKNASFYIKKSTYEIIGYCKVHCKNIDNCKRYYTVDNIGSLDLKKILFTELDKNTDLQNVDYIGIEYQPKHAREKMKMLASAIHDYFILRCLIDKKNHQLKNIKSIDAKNKLTMYEGPPLSCHLKIQYDRNKWYAKEYCKWLLKKHKKIDWLNYFNKFPKKDDLADSFLQGLWYGWYGLNGKKHEINKCHQKLVFFEQNTNKLKKIKAIKPKLNQKRLTLSNIKYYLKYNKPFNSKLESSILYYFGDIKKFRESFIK